MVTAALPDGGQLLFCLRCGGTVVEFLRSLAIECAPRPAAMQPFRKAVLAGRHPKSKVALGPLVLVASLDAAEAC